MLCGADALLIRAELHRAGRAPHALPGRGRGRSDPLSARRADLVVELVRAAGGDFEPGRLVRRSCIRGLPEEVASAYDAPFPTPESKAGVLAFPEHVPTEPDHPNTVPLMAIREALRSWTKPALVLFGDSDPIFSVRVAERIAKLIPGALPAETVANAGHFVQEDAGQEVAERILRFLGR